MKQLIAVPSAFPGGLEAEIFPHFGHCDVFTLVSLEENRVEEVKVVPSVPHEQGGCLAPVGLLAGQGVQALISGGMGMRPLMGFNQVGIDVFFNAGLAKVGQAVAAFSQGLLPKFGLEQTCGGGGGCQH